MIQSWLHKKFKVALNNAHKKKQFYWRAQGITAAIQKLDFCAQNYFLL